MINSYKKGIFSEKIAKVYLLLKGYKILQSRYMGIKGTSFGEIDIIAMRKKTICFIEVKARKDFSTSVHSISDRQMKRIYQSASVFLGSNKKYQNHDCRFDVISVVKLYKIQHLKNIWRL